MATDSHTRLVMAAIEGKRQHQMPNLDPGLLASWMRSVTEHGLDPDRVRDPDVLTHAELQERRAPIEEMSVLSSPEIDRLYQCLSDHAQVVMLSDAQGVVMHFRSSATVVDTCSTLRVLPGSIWNEEHQGTTGLGLCLREQKPLSIVMDEHFATKLSGLSCTVAPIFGAQGRLAGVLNVTAMRSTDHALQGVVREMVTSSARRIENVYFDRRHHTQTRILRLSRHNDFCDAAAEARLALDDNGRIIDATPPASRLLNNTFDAKPSVLIGRKLSSIVDIGNLERFLQEEAPSIDSSHGRIHIRVCEPVRRGASRGQPSGMGLSHTSKHAAISEVPTHPARTSAAPTLEEIVGSDSAMRDRLRMAQRLHSRGLPLLLQGESGCGKTQLAHALHENGPYREGGFVAINCAAIPKELIESELFGHRAGAFTGASKQGSPGRLLGANNGTLFLDEIGDMPLSLQGRLLQVLSEGEFVPVGATQPIKVRFALISASLRDLKSLVYEDRFREDLYYRLSGATLALPPLRERSDLNQLIEQALARAAAEAGVQESALSPAARNVLLQHRWPGNIRELQHVAKFITAMNEDPVIGLEALPSTLAQATDIHRTIAQNRSVATQISSAQSLLALMEQCHWNVSAAAARLGISRATLHRRLNEFDVHRPTKSH